MPLLMDKNPISMLLWKSIVQQTLIRTYSFILSHFYQIFIPELNDDPTMYQLDKLMSKGYS